LPFSAGWFFGDQDVASLSLLNGLPVSDGCSVRCFSPSLWLKQLSFQGVAEYLGDLPIEHRGSWFRLEW